MSIVQNDRQKSGVREDPIFYRLRAQLHRHIVYPGVVLLRGERDVFAAQRELSALERGSPERLRAHQHGKLWAALRYAYAHSPYYAARWPTPPSPTDDADAFAYLGSLPFVDKSALQQHHADLAANPPPRRVTRKTTGGSTGQAVTLLKDRDALAREMAASWLAYGWYGVERGDRAVRFWGDPSSLKRKLRFMAADFAMNRVRFSAFAFSDSDMEAYWHRCVGTRPDYFYGYVSMLVAFAQYLRRAGHDGRALGLQAVITTSEALERPHQELLTETFGCPVQNEYGCGEVGPVAYSCPEGSLHVMADNLVVEVLTESGRPAEPGESGELVLTDLNNRAMPLVRYRVGDLAVAGAPCSCGRAFPTLQRVWGRAYDVLIAPDGRRYHGEYFMYLFEDLRQAGLGVDQFQVVQTAIDTLQVFVVTPGPLRHEATDFIVARIRDRMHGVQVSVERVPELRRAASGKMRVIVNAMAQSATTTA
jgi:phenylacetate-CoA ligase